MYMCIYEFYPEMTIMYMLCTLWTYRVKLYENEGTMENQCFSASIEIRFYSGYEFVVKKFWNHSRVFFSRFQGIGSLGTGTFFQPIETLHFHLIPMTVTDKQLYYSWDFLHVLSQELFPSERCIFMHSLFIF